MSDLAREFVREHREFIVCEPSGRMYTEIIEDKVHLFRLMNEIPNETRKLDKSTLFG